MRLRRVPHSTFVKVLQVSSAHVYLTYPFVLSWSMLEAMSVGCLIIGSATPPVEEVIRDGENGVLVDMFSPNQIAQCVVDALANKATYAEMRRQARRTIVDRYDLRKICLPAQLKLISAAGAGSR